MAKPATSLAEPDDARRRRLLDAALVTFMRFGYRKTSMEEVARAAGLSRQGLYLHFSTKEELFGAVVRHGLDSGLAAAHAALAEPNVPLAQRLVGAFDAWLGRFVGALGGDLADVLEVIAQYGPLIAEYDAQFVDAITKHLRSSPVAAPYKAAGLTVRQLAETLDATARGLKHTCTTRPDFRDRMMVAVRALFVAAGE